MRPVALENIIKWTGGELIAGSAGGEVTEISTDTRGECAGSLFVPLKGENFDGHDFIAEAVGKGAVAIISQREIGADLQGKEVCFIRVADTLRAFQDLAANYRRQFDTTVVAVTGSNGKTTTKEFVKSVAATKFETVASEGTKNNHIGLPQSLFSIGPGTEVAVVELGMSGFGEIRNLSRIASPRIGIITNVFPAHTEFFSSVEDIAVAKAELLEALGEEGVAVLNADDEWFGFMNERARSRVLSFGIDNPADVVGSSVTQVMDGLIFRVTCGDRVAECRVKAFGKHNVYNALAAVAVGAELGIGPEAACRVLSAVALPEMRFQVENIAGLEVINDAYNANPASTFAALEALDAMKTAGRKVALLGDMLELGWYSREGHQKVGEKVARTGLDVLITVGELAGEIASAALNEGFKGEIRETMSVEEAEDVVTNILAGGDILLVKGSRLLKLERVIEMLRKAGIPERG